MNCEEMNCVKINRAEMDNVKTDNTKQAVRIRKYDRIVPIASAVRGSMD